MNDNVIELVWQKAQTVEGYDEAKWRKDFAGAWVQRNQYGLRTEYGWCVDHIIPKSEGGSDEPSNLIPMHWRNNIVRANRYPIFTSVVASEGDKNIDREQSWQISK